MANPTATPPVLESVPAHDSLVTTTTTAVTGTSAEHVWTTGEYTFIGVLTFLTLVVGILLIRRFGPKRSAGGSSSSGGSFFSGVSATVSGFLASFASALLGWGFWKILFTIAALTMFRGERIDTLVWGGLPLTGDLSSDVVRCFFALSVVEVGFLLTFIGKQFINLSTLANVLWYALFVWAAGSVAMAEPFHETFMRALVHDALRYEQKYGPHAP